MCSVQHPAVKIGLLCFVCMMFVTLLRTGAAPWLACLSVPVIGLLAHQNSTLRRELQQARAHTAADGPRPILAEPADSAHLIELSAHQRPVVLGSSEDEETDPLRDLRLGLLQGDSWVPLQLVDMSTSGARVQAPRSLQQHQQGQRVNLLVTIPGHEPRMVAATFCGGRDPSASGLLGLSFVAEHTEDFDSFTAAIRAHFLGETLRLAV